MKYRVKRNDTESTHSASKMAREMGASFAVKKEPTAALKKIMASIEKYSSDIDVVTSKYMTMLQKDLETLPGWNEDLLPRMQDMIKREIDADYYLVDRSLGLLQELTLEFLSGYGDVVRTFLEGIKSGRKKKERVTRSSLKAGGANQSAFLPVDETVVIYRNRKAVSKGRDIVVVRSYAKRFPVKNIERTGTMVKVTFSNSATSRLSFPSTIAARKFEEKMLAG